MEAKPQLEQSMQEEQIRAALNKHWHASAVGDANAEHDIYDDDVVCDYPGRASEFSAEEICRPCGVIIPASRQALRSSGFSAKGIYGSRNTQPSTRADWHIR